MFHIDTNRINARQKLENMNQLETWAGNDVIVLDMAERTLHEASAGSNPQRTSKAMQSAYSMTFADTPKEQELLTQIERILFPNGADTRNKQNDVEIVFNAKKYCRILITDDGGSKKQPMGILGNAAKLKKEIGVEVMTDVDAVALVQRRIESRDARCRRRAELDGTPLPEWIGKD